MQAAPPPPAAQRFGRDSDLGWSLRGAPRSSPGSSGGGDTCPTGARTAYSDDGTATSTVTLPPTPLALPGGWTGSSTRQARVQQRSSSQGDVLHWRLQRPGHTRPGANAQLGEEEEDEDDDEEEAALLLPPPFLAADSPRESFDGLLGTRRARSRSKQQRVHERLFAQGRAPPAPFPGNLVTAALKIARVLGPPGGYDTRALAQATGWERTTRRGGKERGKGWSLDEAVQNLSRDGGAGSQGGRGKYEERQQRRLRRAESGLKAYELSLRVGQKVAGRLERHRSLRDVLETEVETTELKADSNKMDKRILTAVTPAALLGSPPFSPVGDSGHERGAATVAGMDEDDIPPLIPPSAPSLRPMANPDLPPLPTVSTPLALEPAALDDYFGILPRSTGRRPSVSSAFLRQRTLPGAPTTPRTPFTLQSIKRWRKIPAYRRILDLLILILIGSPRTPAAVGAGLDASFATVGGLVGLVVHTIGFVFFVGYHLATLAVASFAALRTTAIFLYWLGMNLSGRTEVAQAVVRYWRACRSEWDRVVNEDGEERLGLWSVGLGLVELALLQSMTYDRWLKEGPGGLVLLNGAESSENGLVTPRFGPQRRKQSLALERPTITERQKSYRWSGEGDEEEGEGLVVTGQTDSLLLGSLISRDQPSPLTATYSDRHDSPSARTGPPSISQRLDHDLTPIDPNGPSQLPSSPPLPPVRAAQDPLAELVALMKRCCRLSTASYGLHTLIPSPPTPLLTPSGQTLPQRVFAHLGGMGDHRDVLHVALQKRYTGLPTPDPTDESDWKYAPQMFLLRDDVRGEIIVVFRGTQSLADLRTDLEGSLASLDLPPLPPLSPSKTTERPDGVDNPRASTARTPDYRIHSGILTTAHHLLASSSPSTMTSPTAPMPSPLLPSLRATLAAHPRYGLVLTGHSLGAALASTVALLLGEWDPASRKWVVRSDAGLDPEPGPEPEVTTTKPSPTDPPSASPDWRRPLRAVCFAHPTTVNAPLAARCAYPVQGPAADSRDRNDDLPLVLNVSLGSDVICRMGIPHVRELRRAIGRLDRERQQRRRRRREKQGADADEDEVDHNEWTVWSGWRAWRAAVATGAGVEAGRLEERAWKARGMAEGWGAVHEEEAMETEDERAIEAAVPAGRAYHLDRLPPSLLQEEEEGEEARWGLYEVGSPRRFFQLPLLRSDLLAAHMPKAYLDACETL